MKIGIHLRAVALLAVTGCTGCGEFLATDAPPEPPGVVEGSGSIDAGSTPAVLVDSGGGVGASDGAAADAGCPTATERLVPLADGILNPSNATNHQDLSDRPVCAMNVGLFCLVRFKRVASASRKVVSVTLRAPRAVSSETDCDGSCGAASWRSPGTILVRQMRADWSQLANWTQRWKDINANDVWILPGAFGSADATTGPIATVSVQKDEDMVVKLSADQVSQFPGPDLAFHLSPAAIFSYILQRKKGTMGSNTTLDVEYCTN